MTPCVSAVIVFYKMIMKSGWNIKVDMQQLVQPLEYMFTTSQNMQKGILRCITSGQSYKASMIVIYDSRVIPDLKIPHITTLDS